MTMGAAKTCARCRETKLADDFLGLRGKRVAECSVCRARMAGRKRQPRTRAELGLTQRSRTERLTRRDQERRDRRVVNLPVLHEFEHERPRTRGDCVDGVRPCPWVACKFHLYLDVNQDSGSILFNWPNIEPDELDPDRSCALDIADRGGGTLEDVGLVSNVSRERIRQIETRACTRVQRSSAYARSEARLLREYEDDGVVRPSSVTSGNGNGSIWKAAAAPASPHEIDEDVEETELPTQVSFFSDHDAADASIDDPAWDRVLKTDELVADSVWRMFARDSNQRGFDCRSGASIRMSKYLAHKRDTEGVVMANGEVLEPRLALVLSAYNALIATGDKPTLLAIANKAEIEGVSEKSRQQNVCNAMGILRRRGIIDASGKVNAKKPPTHATAIVVRKDVTPKKIPPPEQSGTLPVLRSTSSSLDVLRAELADHETRAGRIKQAIAILEAPIDEVAS